MQLSEAIDKLLLATQADGRSPNTITDYTRKLRPLTDFLGDVDIETITADDLRRYIVGLRKRETVWENHPHLQAQKHKLSPYSVAGYIRVLKRLFNWLEQEEILPDNPARRIKTPSPKIKKPHAIEPEDLKALLRTTEGNTPADRRDRAIILLLADSGCRVGGLCGLRLEDVNLATHDAIVREKGGKERIVFFTDPTAQALQEWLDVRPSDAGDAFFVSLGRRKPKSALSTNAVSQMLHRRAKTAHISGRVNPHSFRHAFAREYLLSGGDLATLSDLMGHESIEITKDYYLIFKVAELRRRHQKHSPVMQILGRK